MPYFKKPNNLQEFFENYSYQSKGAVGYIETAVNSKNPEDLQAAEMKLKIVLEDAGKLLAEIKKLLDPTAS